MRAVQAGDLEAFEQLYRRYRRPLFRFLRRYLREPADAEEVFQETFLRAFEHRHRFAPDTRFATWLYAIARNTSLDRLKRAERRVALAPEATELLPHVPPAADHALNQQRQTEAVRRALDTLPQADREVLLLRAEALPYEAIAGVIGTTPAAARQRFHRALRALRAALEGRLSS